MLGGVWQENAPGEGSSPPAVEPAAEEISIRLRSRPLPGLGAQRLWTFLWSSPQIPRWFGEAPAGPVDHSLVTVTSPTTSPRTGRLDRDADDDGLGVVLTLVSPGCTGAASTECAIWLEDTGHDSVRVVIEEDGFASWPDAELARTRWLASIAQIEHDVARARRRDEQPRQAVVVFHGMGSQRPGDTLTSLVTGGAIPASRSVGGGASGWVKPDRLSDLFELRSYVLRADAELDRPATDVYEAYWAHLAEGTTTSQVTSWAFSVLRTWRNVPRQLAISLWLIRVLVVLGLGLVVAVQSGWITLPPWLTGWFVLAIGAVVWGLVSKVYAGVLGDVARYLRPLPENIETRQRIREVGVDLLSRLHDDGRYDRIVVLGHSLGSVVAYDVLTQLWIERHRQHDRPAHTTFAPLRSVERAATGAPDHHGGGHESVGVAQARERQHLAWAALRENTQPWLVTDFVTVGSPLAHATTLLAKNPRAFAAARHARVLPTCPPVVETERRSRLKRITYDRGYRSPEGEVRTFTLFHHAALFAVTRWTNLSFRPRLLGLRGDPVGGPIGPVFGRWVRDVELETQQWIWRAHTGYWSPGTSPHDGHLAQLRAALDLEKGGDLRAVCRRLPLHLPRPRSHRNGPVEGG
jgi:hypothetical protein